MENKNSEWLCTVFIILTHLKHCLSHAHMHRVLWLCLAGTVMAHFFSATHGTRETHMGARLMDAMIDKCGIAIVTDCCITRTTRVRDKDNQRRRRVAKGPACVWAKAFVSFSRVRSRSRLLNSCLLLRFREKQQPPKCNRIFGKQRPVLGGISVKHYITTHVVELEQKDKDKKSTVMLRSCQPLMGLFWDLLAERWWANPGEVVNGGVCVCFPYCKTGHLVLLSSFWSRQH